MFHLLRAVGLLVFPAALALPALAQSAPPRTAVAEPVAQQRPLPDRSAFEGYQPFSEQQPIPWREANDTVGKIGGWRAYAKQVQDAKPAEPAPAASPRAQP